MSFFRTSKATYSALVPVLLSGLLATGIVFVESTPATAAPCSTTATGYAGGDGTSGDPFLISSADQLIRLSTTSADWAGSSFKQTADIDLNDCEWTPVGTDANRFTGSYDGSGFTIRGLNINRTGGSFANDRVGLFGSISAATIEDLIVEGQITSSSAFVGGLVGEARASTSLISKVLVLVDITFPGDNYMGGMVGSFLAGTIRYSAYRGDIVVNSSWGSVGSFVGTNVAGTTISSYGRANMSGTSEYKAGMNGHSAVTVSKSYTVTPGANAGVTASNSSGTVTNSFWDTTVGPTNARRDGVAVTGATGKSSTELQTMDTYTAANWDIVNGWEAFSTSGTPKIWGICSAVNDGYPFLLWEYNTDPCLYPASAPAITSIAASSGSLSIAFTAPSSNGGDPISNYKYSIDNGATWITRSPVSTASPLVVTGLTNGTSYQVKLLAVNSEGDGAVSAAVTGTPAAPAPSPTPSSSPTPTVATSVASAPIVAAPAGATLATAGTNATRYLSLVLLLLAIGAFLVWLGRSRKEETSS